MRAFHFQALVCGLLGAGSLLAQGTVARSPTSPTLSASPRHFEQNLGQANPQVAFLSRGSSHTLFLTRNGDAVLSIGREKPDSGQDRRHIQRRRTALRWERTAVRMRLVGAQKPSSVTALEPLIAKSNYFLGRDPKQWITGVPSFNRIAYQGVYPGIDLHFHAGSGQLEYDFVLAPWANADSIQLEYTGASTVSIEPNGDLRLGLPIGSVYHRRPVAYQLVSGLKRSVPCSFRSLGKGRMGLSLAPYNKRLPVTIDPVLAFSTIVDGSGAPGGAEGDATTDVAVDSAGDAYVVGYTYSADFPLFSSMGTVLQPNFGGAVDAYLEKFSRTGLLLYATYLGGSGLDTATSVAVDSTDSVYVVGYTSSQNFPLVNAYRANQFGELSGFLCKVAGGGSSITYSTFLPFSTSTSVAVDTAGSAHVTGTPQVPLPEPAEPCWLAKLAPSGTSMSFLGTIPGADFVSRIALDGQGNIYVTGDSNGGNPDPVLSPSQAGWRPTRSSGSEAVAAKFSSAGVLQYLTYLGGSGQDHGFGIAVDASGAAFVCGTTASADFPTVSPLDASLGGAGDGFLVKLQPDGKSAQFSTYLGGTGMGSPGVDAIFDVAVRAGGDPVVVGVTECADFPVVGSVQGRVDVDAFVTQFAPSGQALTFSTFLGGHGPDRAKSVTVDPFDDIVVSGDTEASDFPSLNAFQPAPMGPTHGWLAKFSFASPPSVVLLDPTPNVAGLGTTVNLVVRTSLGVTLTPVVTVGGRPATFLSKSLGKTFSLLWNYSLTLNGTEGSPHPAIVAKATAPSGLSATATSAALTTDFLPPTPANLVVSPAAATAGTTVTVSFEGSEALAAAPDVTLGGKEATATSGGAAGFTYARVIDGTETEGQAPVVVGLRDLVGNTGTTTVTMVLDFHAPEATYVSVEPASAEIGSTVTVTIDVNEMLGQAPTLTVGGKTATLLSSSGNRYRFQRVIDGSEGEPTPVLRFESRDVLGNAGVATSTGLSTSFGPLTLTVSAEPLAAKSGSTVTVGVEASKTLTAPPTVHLGSMGLSLSSQSGRTYAFSRTLDGTEVQGATAVHVSAQATSGEAAADDSKSVIIDFEAPRARSVTVTPELARVGATVQISFSTSESLTTTPAVKIGGLGTELVSLDGGGYIFQRLIQSTDGEGVKVLSIDLVDPAGNGAQDVSGSVTMDFTPASFVNVVADPAIAGLDVPVRLSFQATEALTGPPLVLVGATFATLLSSVNQDYTYGVTVTAAFGDGKPLVSIKGTDLAGNAGITSVKPLETDVTPPAFSSIEASPNLADTGKTVTVSFAASEPVPVAPLVLVGGVVATKVTSAGQDFVYRTITEARMGEGRPSIRVIGRDVAGNQGESAGTPLLTDFSVPQVSVSAFPDRPAEGATVRFSGSGSTARSGITSFAWLFGDGTTSTEADANHSFSDNGVYTVSLRVTSGVGETGTAQILLPVTNVSPTVVVEEVTSPARGRIPLSWTVSDPGSIDTFRYSLVAKDLISGTTTQIVSDEASTGSLSLDTTTLQESSYQLAIIVTDKDGGQGGRSFNPVIVDNSPLTIEPAAAQPSIFNPVFGETTVLPYFLSEHATTRVDIIRSSTRSFVVTAQGETSERAGQSGVTWTGRDPVDDSILADDDYAFLVTGTDALGQSVSESSERLGFTITLHTTVRAPVITPAPASPTRISALTLEGTKPANSGIIVSRGSETLTSSPGDAFLSWSTALQLLEGRNDFVVIAQDSLGVRSPGVGVSVTLKTTPPPQVAIDPVTSPAPEPDQVITGRKAANTALLLRSGSEPEAESMAIGPETTWSARVTYLAGSTPFTFTARDEVGNLGPSSTVTITLEPRPITAPTIAQVPSPTKTSNLVLTGTRQSDTSVEVLVESLDSPGLPTTFLVSADPSTEWSIPVLAREGMNRVTAQSFDSIRSASPTTSIPVLADTRPPIIRITGVLNADVTTATAPTIGVSYEDPTPGSSLDISTLVISVDGFDATAASTVGSQSATLPRFVFTPGQHFVAANVADRAGHRSGAGVFFTVVPFSPGDPPILTLFSLNKSKFSPALNPYRSVHEDRVDLSFGCTQSASLEMNVLSSAGATVLSTGLPSTTPGQESVASWNGRTSEGDLVDNGTYAVRVTATNATGQTSSLADVLVQIHY